MKKSVLRSVLLLIVCGTIFIGCKKDDDEPAPSPTPTAPVVPPSFTWSVNNGSVTSVADSTYYYSSVTSIYAFKGGTSNYFEVDLSSLAPATYSFSSITGNTFRFETSGTAYTATAGTLAITTVSNNRLSGNFNVALSGGTITTVKGEFKEIPGRN